MAKETFIGSAFGVTASDGTSDTSGFTLTANNWTILNSDNTPFETGTGTYNTTDKTTEYTTVKDLVDGATYKITVEYQSTGATKATSDVFTYVYDDGIVPILSTKVSSTNSTDKGFGTNVYISSNGLYMVIGCRNAVYAYDRSTVDSVWSTPKLICTKTNTGFPYWPIVSDDGLLIAVGDPDSLVSGKVDIYERTSLAANWQFKYNLTSSNSNALRYGIRICMTGDGLSLIVSDYADQSNPSVTLGAIDVYNRTSRTANFSTKTTISAPSEVVPGAYFGLHFYLSRDGLTLMVGTSTNITPPYNYTEATYVYTRANKASNFGTYSKVAKSDIRNSLMLSNDGARTLNTSATDIKVITSPNTLTFNSTNTILPSDISNPYAALENNLVMNKFMISGDGATILYSTVVGQNDNNFDVYSIYVDGIIS